MHKLLARLRKDHVNLSRVLDLLSTQLDHFFAGEASNFDLKIEMLEYLESYADQNHHPVENRIFEQWLKMAPESRDLVERLVKQHQEIHTLTHTFRQSLENIMSGAVMPRDELETQGREYVALQRQHLTTEEREVFPLVDESFSDQDWDEVEKDLPGKDDPLFDLPDANRFQTLIQYLAEHEASESD